MGAKRINWAYYAGCLAVGTALATAFIIGDLYGPSRTNLFAFSGDKADRAMQLCRLERGIDSRHQLELCVADELLAGGVLNAHLIDSPGTVPNGCMAARVLIGHRAALDCAMGRNSRAKTAAPERGAPGLAL